MAIGGSATMRATKTSRRISFAGVQEVLDFAVQCNAVVPSFWVLSSFPLQTSTLYVPVSYTWGMLPEVGLATLDLLRGLTLLLVVDWLHVQPHTSSVHVAYHLCCASHLGNPHGEHHSQSITSKHSGTGDLLLSAFCPYGGNQGKLYIR